MPKKQTPKKKTKNTRRKPAKPRVRRRRQMSYPAELRKRVVKAVVEDEVDVQDVADTFELSGSTVRTWVSRYLEDGVEGLDPKPTRKRGDRPKPADNGTREAVTRVKREHPEYGSRRIEDVLARFEGLGVSEHTVRRILHEEGLIEPAASTRERGPKPPRRFERSQPNQMWLMPSPTL